MTDLTTRVRTVLGANWDEGRNPWEGLLRLYEEDPEAFYLLGCEPETYADPVVDAIAKLARQLRIVIRFMYYKDKNPIGEVELVTMSGRLLLPPGLVERVWHFLLDLDDKGVSSKPGKDYEGSVVTEAEVRFKTGNV